MGLWSGHIFYANDFEKPAIWIAIYAACMKSLWGVFGATLVLGSALNTGCKEIVVVLGVSSFHISFTSVYFSYIFHSVFDVYFRGIQKYIANASVPYDGKINIWCLPYSSNSYTSIVWQHAPSILYGWFSSGEYYLSTYNHHHQHHHLVCFGCFHFLLSILFHKRTVYIYIFVHFKIVSII